MDQSNYRKKILLICPKCRRHKRVNWRPGDPINIAKVRAICDRHPEYETDTEQYFDRHGRLVKLLTGVQPDV